MGIRGSDTHSISFQDVKVPKANRIGEDGLGVGYNGQSAVYSPKGETLIKGGHQERLLQMRLSMEDLQQFRGKFPAHLDADLFHINATNSL